MDNTFLGLLNTNIETLRSIDNQQQSDEQIWSIIRLLLDNLDYSAAEIAKLEKSEVIKAASRMSNVAKKACDFYSESKGVVDIAAENKKIGSIIRFGSYDWRVLDVQNSRALVLSDEIIERRAYNETYADVTWKSCTLRAYLNGDFHNTFSDEDKSRIIETTNQNANNLWYGTTGGRDTRDKIFLLSLDEVDKYFGNSGDYRSKRSKRQEYGDDKYYTDSNGWYLSNSHDSQRMANFDNKRAWWWLRAPGFGSIRAAYVISDGAVRVSGLVVDFRSGGVRPALWLNL